MEHRHLAVLFLFLSLCLNRVDPLNTGTDEEALLSFKILLSDPQNTLSGWNHTSPLCTWFGVYCTPLRNRVQSLRLRGLGLSGTIPHRLSNLTSLESLDLSDNLFHGTIPQEFSRLSHLRHLILAQNSIGGTIPLGLSHCSKLEEIDLQSNKLNGCLPKELGLLSNLKILNVAQNNLTGLIPPTFGNLTFLTHLFLTQNQFMGRIPNELGLLQNLQYFFLVENNFTGEIPYSIFNLSSLICLSVTQNMIIGKLPSDMNFSLPNLQELYMAGNYLHGAIPSFISSAPKIRRLDLSWNGFQGEMPLFGKMNDLVVLSLVRNNLSSTTEHNLKVINSLTNCTRLEFLLLAYNQLAGKLPSSTANLSIHLQRFCVEGNLLSGKLPQGIGNYHNLELLLLYENYFQGTVPTSIELLHRLKIFQLHQNMMSGEIPNSFGNLTQLYVLTMGWNQFSGSIPKSIGDCPLDLLGLAGNRLSGSIPKEIFSQPNLRDLLLAQNSLSGSLPAEVGMLKQLALMNISGNHLSGVIPAAIGGCSSLSSVNMSSNKFHGSIPKSIGQLLALESLDLSSNNLSGPIPDDLEILRVLQALNLSFNDLEGQVPREGAFKNLTWSSLQGNNKLCVVDQKATEKLRIPICFTTKKKKNGSFALKITISIASFIVLVCFLLFMVRVLISLKKSRNRTKRSNSPLSLKGRPPKISYSEILSATNGFSNENLIGKGGFGSVYKGVFVGGGSSLITREDGASTIVAIKVLDLKQSKASRSFTAECEALRSVRHRNLVKVITSCSSTDHGGAEFKALVMEFMSNSSLDKWLYPEDTGSGISRNLSQRLNIAIDVASAVDYLHHDCEPPVVHCDLKPGNVLLDDDMGAHVGDFGLARFLYQNTAQNQCSTILLKGSIGYIPPEYGLGGQVSTSGDVYSYGILLLEIFTGKKPTDEMFKDGLNLHKFASAVYENKIWEIVDLGLIENNYTDINTNTSDSSVGTTSSSSTSSSSTNTWRSRKEKCLSTVIKLGLSCAADVVTERLTMREALARVLEIKESLFKS